MLVRVEHGPNLSLPFVHLSTMNITCTGSHHLNVAAKRRPLKAESDGAALIISRP